MRMQKTASIGFLFALLGAGCASGGSEQAAPAAPAPKPPEVKVAAVEEEQTFEEYTFDPGGKRDPFRPPQEISEPKLAEAGPGEAPPPVGPPPTPLEELDVVEWKLTAVIQTPGSPKAMVEDSSGRGYVIELGTTIGRWKGKVARIEEDRIVVVETYKDQRGGERRQEIPLLLRNPEEKDKQAG